VGDLLWRWLYGPNVMAAVVGAAGVLTVFFALFIASPAGAARRVMGRSTGTRGTLAAKLRQANLPVTPDEFLRVGAAIAISGGILGYLLTHTISGAFLGLAAGPFLYWGYLENRRDKTRREYQAALARVAAIIRDVVTGGEDLTAALAAVAERGPSVVRDDFREVMSRIGAGATVEQALDHIRKARQDPILDVLVDVLVVHQQHGGRMREVLSRLAAATRRRAEIVKRVQAEQTRIVWEARFVSIAPFLGLAAFRMVAPELVVPFYSTWQGELLVVGVGLLCAFGYWFVMETGTRPLRILDTAGVAEGD